MTNYYGKPSAPPRLVGRLLPRHISMDMQSGVYIGGDFMGEAQGWYVENVKTSIPDGCYRDGGLVDPYYEKIRDAALAEGGGLYLFQLEHGEYAGEQVIWQEMAETNPWTPGLGLPQGKTYDLMGSGEYLGQSVSMRRPVDGVFDGVSSWMDASSKAVGDKLHQNTGSAWFGGLEISTDIQNASVIATKNNTSNASGVEAWNTNSGLLVQRTSNGGQRRVGFAYTVGINESGGEMVVGGSYGSRAKLYKNSTAVFDGAMPAPYADVPSDHVLRVGATAYGGQLMHARYIYVAIYTREPTALEISLHKRTP